MVLFLARSCSFSENTRDLVLVQSFWIPHCTSVPCWDTNKADDFTVVRLLHTFLPACLHQNLYCTLFDHVIMLIIQMQFLGVHQPNDASRSEAVGPQAIIVGQAGSPGVGLDLGRAAVALPGATRGYTQCDVLLVMTRKRAVLLYFAVGEDVRWV